MVLRIALGATFVLILLGQLLKFWGDGHWGPAQTILAVISAIGLLSVTVFWNRVSGGARGEGARAENVKRERPYPADGSPDKDRYPR